MRRSILIAVLTIIYIFSVYKSVFSWIIPDTGQTKCYDSSSEISCPYSSQAFYGQDASYTINPMSYTKLDAQGKDLSYSASQWVMVRDNVTGLIWEVKQNMDGVPDYSNPHDADNLYTWYEANSESNVPPANSFIKILNASNFGGFSDWRLPTVDELVSIVNYGRYNPAIDTNYFPFRFNGWFYRFWTSYTDVSNSASAWYVEIGGGLVATYPKSEKLLVRAVRSGESRLSNRFIINNSDIITDIETGLMWQRLSNSSTMNWEQSINYCENLQLAGYNDWRLPTIKELQSIVDYRKNNPAINTDIFLNTAEKWYWSSSTFEYYPIDHSARAKYVDFNYGNIDTTLKSDNYNLLVRCVRSVKPLLAEQNDNFADATVIIGSSGQITGKNINASKEASELDHAGNRGGKTVWWKWTSPVKGYFYFDTHGSNFDTIIAVYKGQRVDNLEKVASNDDDDESIDHTSSLIFQADSDVQYYIVVDGYDGQSGNITLNWRLTNPPVNELKINSVYPKLGIQGQGLPITIKGNGFDQNTRVIMMLDSRDKTTMNTPSYAKAIAVSGSKAYIADDFAGLAVVNISNPSNPNLVGPSKPWNHAYYANDVAISDYTAYVTIDGIGLQIINMTNLSDTKVIGNLNVPYNGVAISGSKAYAVGKDIGLVLIDVSIPSSPKIISTLKIVDVVTSVAESGSTVYVYVGTENTGIQIVDITNPLLPKIIGSLAISSGINFIISGQLAYISNGNKGLKIIDISNPSKPVTIAVIPIYANDAAIIGNNVLIASGYDGLAIVPLPIEVKPTIINSNTLSVTIPSPQLAGNYTIRVFNNNNEYFELPGAVTFVPSEKEYLLKTKAILVNGTTHNDQISAETKFAADYAYQTLLFQGYTAESIRYLSFDTSSEGVDAKATYSAVYDAVNNWTKQEPAATELLIYLADHGSDGTFIISETESLRAEDLDMWLDNLQNTLDIPVTVIYDACESGTFLSKLQPRAGKKRILMTSASVQPALFFGGGKQSFSYQFWDAIYRGEEIDNAFLYAKNQMLAHQTAQLDANGNGISNEADDEKQADGIKLRRGYRPDIDTPYIYKVSEPQTIRDQSVATLKAYVSFVQNGMPIRKVSAIITPPDFDFASPDTPITDLPEIELQYKGDDLYETVYTDFNKNGTYKITICAVNVKGANALYRQTSVIKDSAYIGKVSEPKVLYGGNNSSATLWASLDSRYKGITMHRVWARITPPLSGIPPFEIDLSDPEKDGIYQADYSNFTDDGTYLVSIFGKDDKGYISPVMNTTVTRSGISPNADEYEDDDIIGKATLINFNEFLRHNFHDADDADWIRFFAQAGKVYTIRTSTPNSACDTAIELYRRNGAMLQSVNSETAGQGESYDWKCPETDVYAVKVKNAASQIFGKDIAYDVQVYQPIAGITGIIQGTVKDKMGNPIADARISGGDGSGLSGDNGFYTIQVPTGMQILRVEADGYAPFETTVAVAENQIKNQIVILYPMAQIRKGDVSGDGNINLSDVIAALRAVSGIADQPVHSEADVNGDGKIGMEEVIYILQKVAGLR